MAEVAEGAAQQYQIGPGGSFSQVDHAWRLT
jgi:hypothetical protein